MLSFDAVEWDDESDPAGNVQHIARHGLSPEEVEDVLSSPAVSHGASRSSGRDCVWGRTMTGKHVIVFYRLNDDDGFTTIRPITAYEVPVRGRQP